MAEECIMRNGMSKKLLQPSIFRSQPPFLIPMVYQYYEATGNKTFLQQVYQDLDKEFQFWQLNRSVTVTINATNYTVYRYDTPSNVPRPESYKEDIFTAKNLTTEAEKRELWHVWGQKVGCKSDFRTLPVLQNRDWISVHDGLLTN